MTRHVFWQAALVVFGVALALVILLQVDHEVPAEPVTSKGGTYAEGVVGYASAVNPILAARTGRANPVDQDLSALVFDGLTRVDSTGQVTAALATDWDLSADGLVYEFRLREGVVWHDGAPFTAADVVFTAQAMQDAAYQGDMSLHALWSSVRVERVDDLTVRFTLAEPFPSFIYYATIGLLPSHLLGDVPAEDLATDYLTTERPVGTGMFQVEAMLGDRVVLSANPQYWGPKPYLERLEFWFYAEESDLQADYERGAIQGFHPSEDQTLQSLSRLPDSAILAAPAAGYRVVYLNLKREDLPFFQVKEVRQALLYAIDRQGLLDQLLEGMGIVADSPVLPALGAHDSGVRRYGYDRERAIGLLDASGWVDTDGDRIRDRDGRPLSFTLLTVDDRVMKQTAEEIARQWLSVGVEAKVWSLNALGTTTVVRQREYQAALVDVALSADPDPYPLWHSTQATAPGQNFSGFSNEEADLAMEEARLTTDDGQRTQLYRSFQRIFAEEVPSLLISYPVYTYVVSDQVHGVQLSPMFHTSDRFRNVAEWYREVVAVGITATEQLDK